MGTTFKAQREEQLLWVEQARHSRHSTDGEGRFHQWDEGRPRGSAKGHEIDVAKFLKVMKASTGARDVVDVPVATKASDSALAEATNADVTRTKL